MNFICSYRDCSLGEIETGNGRVEIRASLPKKRPKDFKTFKLKWQENGDAVLHHDCWETITKALRSRSKKNVPSLSTMEKSLLREATKTAEFHDADEKLEEEAKRISEMIQKAEYCVVFSGAGISTSAGIGDYRGKSGKWTEEERMVSTSSLEAQEDDDENHDIEPKKKKSSDHDDNGSDDDDDDDDDEIPEEGVPYEQLRPTYTHEAIYKLFQMGFIKHVISQNGDGLHALSGFSLDHLSELHGNVFLEKCEKCGTIYERDYYVLDDNGSSYFEELNECGASDIKKPRNARQCDMCGLTHRTGKKCIRGFLMDTIINFGDDLEEEIFGRATANAKKSDLMLCLGTTLTVTPANELVEVGKKPLRLVICNRQKTSLDKVCLSMDESDRPLGSRVFGDCDLLMRKIMSNLLTPQELQEWEKKREDRMKDYDSKRATNI